VNKEASVWGKRWRGLGQHAGGNGKALGLGRQQYPRRAWCSFSYDCWSSPVAGVEPVAYSRLDRAATPLERKGGRRWRSSRQDSSRHHDFVFDFLFGPARHEPDCLWAVLPLDAASGRKQPSVLACCHVHEPTMLLFV